MRRTFTALALTALSLLATAQVNEVYVYGAVKDVTTAKKIGGIKVAVYKNGTKVDETITNASGKYEFSLDYGADYKLVWNNAEYVEKNITIDTRNVAEELRVGGHSMNIEMTMLPHIEGIDYTPLLQPFGKANFSPAEENFTWDMEYTTSMRNAQAKLLKEYENRQKQAGKADEEYDKLMKQGETAMTKQEFSKAVEAFNGALQVKAKDPQATARLSDAQMRLDEQLAGQKLEEDYNKLIDAGDALFKNEKFEEAKGKYQEALTLKENEPYPKGRIAEADKRIAELAKQAEEEKRLQEIQAKYDAVIAAADAAFDNEQYENAQAKYNEALTIKADEQYPKDRLAAIDEKLKELAEQKAAEEEQKKLDEQYNAAIAAADAAFQAQNYEQASAKYNEAIGLKPDENYPKDQLKAIEDKLKELAEKAEEEARQKEIDEQYNAAIAAADASFQAENYEDARVKYEDAIRIKDEQYPKDQLEAITKKLNEIAAAEEEAERQRKIDEEYNALVADADAAFGAEELERAKEKYNEALGVKPDEQHPKDRIAAIDERIAELRKQEEEAAKAAEIEEAYAKAIAVADKEFKKENYMEAKASYEEATQLKTEEQYPRDQLAAIEAVLAEIAKQEEEERKAQELEAQYTSLIDAADQAFKSEAYSEALNGYKNALELKPGEKHPADRVVEIEGLLDAEQQAQAEQERLEQERLAKEQRYNDLIAQADQAFAAEDYEEARSGYEQALEIKNEDYPQDQLKAIDNKLKELEDLAEQERKAAEDAAKEAERLEQERLRALENEQQKRQRFEDAVAAGDMALQQEEFDVARDRYSEAIGILPDEQYPKDKLAEIEATLAERQRLMDEEAREAERLRAEAEAERLRQEREAEDARLAAERERERLASLKDKQEQYDQLVLDADEAYADEDYEQARSLYAQAMDLMPDESYPPTRIEQIDLMLAEEERKRREAEELAARKRLEEEERQREREANATVDLRKEEEAEKFMREARLREEAEKYERIKKFKQELSEEERALSGAASDRRSAAYQGKQTIRDNELALYQGSEEWRQQRIDEVEARKATLKEQEKQRVTGSNSARNAAYDDKLALQQDHLNTARTWDDRHHDRVMESVEEKEELERSERERIEAMRDRNTDQAERVLEVRQEQQAMTQRGQHQVEANRGDVSDLKRSLEATEASRRQRAGVARNQAREELYELDSSKPKGFEDYNRSKLALAYPEGVTEESYTEGNKVIIRRVVVKANKADEYSKVIAKWGTFYFKNGQSISVNAWNEETSGQ